MTSASSESISYDNSLVGNWRGNDWSNRGMQSCVESRAALPRDSPNGRRIALARPQNRKGRVG